MATFDGPRKLSMLRPVTATESDFVADHRYSEQELVDLLGALRARAASHPDNPGLVAFWPTVPADRMAAGCRLLARRGHTVQPVPVAGWEPGKTRNGWALRTAQPDRADPDAERWTNEGGSFPVDAPAATQLTPEPSR